MILRILLRFICVKVYLRTDIPLVKRCTFIIKNRRRSLLLTRRINLLKCLFNILHHLFRIFDAINFTFFFFSFEKLLQILNLIFFLFYFFGLWLSWSDFEDFWDDFWFNTIKSIRILFLQYFDDFIWVV